MVGETQPVRMRNVTLRLGARLEHLRKPTDGLVWIVWVLMYVFHLTAGPEASTERAGEFEGLHHLHGCKWEYDSLFSAMID